MSDRHLTSALSKAAFRIIVPIDGSEESIKAINLAKQIPASEIVLMSIGSDLTYLVPDLIPDDIDSQEIRLRADLELLAEPLRDDGINVRTIVRFGDPAERIIAEAEAESADLIIMTTHGRSAAGRAIFGSVADRVCRHGTTPTILIRHGDGASHAALPTRIVVPLDGSELAEQALPIALRLALALAVPVQLVRAVTLDDVLQKARELEPMVPSGIPPLDAADERFDRARVDVTTTAQAYLADCAVSAREQGVSVTTDILHGTPSALLVQNSTLDDLLVMTSHGESGFRRWLIGSVAEKLMREARSPILLVPTRN